MAANGTAFVKGQRNFQGFTAVLTSAACEWFLIFLLLIDAVLSYLLTKFARYCELQIPCILCSRIDHVLGSEKPAFYQNLLCSNHMSEISSLISCHIHGRLADGCGMCEDCLLSFASEKEPNPDMHRLLVARFGFDLGSCGFQNSLRDKGFFTGSTSKKSCTCCNKPWRLSRQNAQGLLPFKPSRGVVTRPNIPLAQRLNRRESFKKTRGRLSGSVKARCLGKSGYDPLSHVGYTELKFTSDNESEFPFSDEDGRSNVLRGVNEPKEEFSIPRASGIPPKTLCIDLASAKLANRSSNPRTPPNVSEPRDVKCLASDVASELGELNWQQSDQKVCPSPPELICLDDIPPSSNTHGVSAEKCDLKFPLPQNFKLSAPAELLSLVDAPSSYNVGANPVGELPRKTAEALGIIDCTNVSFNKHEKVLELVDVTAEDVGKHEHAIKNPFHEDLSDVRKPAAIGKDKEASSFVSEQITMKEQGAIHDDLKQLLPQSSAAQDSVLASDVTTANLHSYVNELPMIDASSIGGVQMLPGSVPIEGTDSSGLESSDGSFVGEIEGEHSVDQLKRRIEYDRKCMNVLYRELEEERNASEVATNQAMAMITRLQEEKAALHMEALQYLRMMEEQAEYDVEALEKANDLLAEREKDVQDLEAELEYFRLKYPQEFMEEMIPGEDFDSKVKITTAENKNLHGMKDDVNIHCNLVLTEECKASEKPVVKSSLSELGKEKFYISQCLKSLEKTLQQFSHNGASIDMSDATNTEEGANSEGQNVSKESNLLVSTGKKSSLQQTENDLAALQNEISDLNERLETLETDCNFLEHILNSLQSGNDGLQYVQEIAYHLQELRKIGIRNKCQGVP